jgi:PAS domain S-box-containing protein
MILQHNSDKHIILYVDDEIDNLKSFKALFRRDYHVHLAESAQEALEILRTENVHVLVTDQRMPEMSGTALLEQAAEEFPDVLRYMLTGYSDYDPLVDAINKGKVHGYFSKPLNIKEFYARVEKGLEIFLLKEHNLRLLEELQKSQAKLRQAHQLALIGIWDWDKTNDRISWSDVLCQIAGLDPGQAPRSIAELPAFFEAESWRSFEEAINGSLMTGEPYKLELAMRRPDSSVRWVYVFGGPTLDPYGAITGLHGTIQDITEEKRAKEELRLARDKANAANIAKNLFLANMSHEIRTPLNGIYGMLQVMKTTSLNEDQHQYVSMAIKSAKRLTRLLSDILDLSAIESGRVQIKEAAFDIQEMRDSVLELFEVEANSKEVTLEWSVATPMPPQLIGDEGRLRQVLFNLVGNAVKFTEKGVVRVEISQLPASATECCRLLFTVSDTGIGIAEGKFKDIFEPFVQAEESTYSRAFQGAGLGLAIVRNLVTLMGGNLAIDSVEGGGTTVYFSLPFGVAGEKPEMEQITTEEQAQCGKPIRVLLAEDDETSSASCKNMLQMFGHIVVTAKDGQEALHLVARQDFNLILMDVQMPVMNGVEATKEIRDGRMGQGKANVPIIAMTAYAMIGDREKFLAAGMDDYIAKPVEMASLKETIGRVMAKREQNTAS